MPIKQNVIMVLDTETADLTGSVYDVGAVITTRKGEILEVYSALVSEVFEDADRMMGAFYAKKLFTHYARALQDDDISLVPWAEICANLARLVETHNVNVISAYNLKFDLRVMKSTNKMLGGTSPILPKREYKLLDLWRFACEAKLNTRLYKDLARSQGWFSEAGNLKTGAEYAYRFCAGDWGFIEDHTALSDALIETEIMKVCFAARKPIPYEGDAKTSTLPPWQIVNPRKKRA